MRVVAISNQKGGAAKTTTAVNLAAALAAKRKRVLLVDFDPQGSASYWTGADGAELGADLLFRGRNIADIARFAFDDYNARITVIPAGGALDTLEKHNVAALAGSLRSAGGEYDYCLLDTPPAFGPLSASALMVADSCLVPVEAAALAIRGVHSLLDIVAGIRRQYNPGLALGGIVACRVDYRTRLACEAVAYLREEFGDALYKTVVRQNVKLAESASWRRPISAYAPNSTGAEDYARLAREFLHREK